MKRYKILLAVLALLLWMMPRESLAAAEESPAFTIYFFHDTSCGTCDGTADFYEIFNDQVGDIKANFNYEILTYNIFQASGLNRFEEELAKIGLTREDANAPCLIIGEDVLSGLDNIKTGIRELFIKYGEGYEIHYVEPAAATENTATANAFQDVTVNPDAHTITFFYTLSCEDCERAEKILDTLPEEMDGKPVELKAFSIAEADGIEKIRALFDAYAVPDADQMVPIIFYKDGYMAGAEQIGEELETRLAAGDFLNMTYPEEVGEIDPIQAKDLPAIVLTGFINGFNPCSISILFLLLSLIMMDKSKILKVGFTFIAGKFLTYFALGIGLYSLASVMNFVWLDKVQLVLNIILIIAALYLAVLNLMDFFAVRREEYGKVKAQLPAGLRKFNNNIVKYVLKDQNRRWLLPLIFLAAVIISGGEFLCTGQIYLGTIIYMLKRGTGSMTITVIAFLLYIAAMCLPQVIMIIAVRAGANVIQLTESTRQKFPIIKFVNFLVFLAFAVLLFWLSFLR